MPTESRVGIQVTTDDLGIDEVFCRGTCHVERMDNSVFALVLVADNGESACFWLLPRRAPHRKNGARPHVQVTLNWHDKPEGDVTHGRL